MSDTAAAESAPSAEPAAPTPEPAASPKPEAAKPPSVSDQFAQHMKAKQAARNKRAAKPPPAEPAKPATAAPTPAEGTKLEIASPPAPTNAPPAPAEPQEPESKTAIAHARALRALEQRDAELAQVRRETAADTKDAKSYRALRERLKTPESKIDAIEQFLGEPLANIIEGLAQGKIPPPRGRRHDLPPELLEQIEETRSELAQLRAEREQTSRKAAFDTDVATTKGWIERNAESMPFLSASGWAANVIVQQAHAQPGEDPTKIANTMEAGIRANVMAVLENERALKALLKGNEKLRTALRAELGLGEQQPASSNGSGPQRTGDGARPQSDEGKPRHALGASSSEGAGPPDLSSMTRKQIDDRAHDEFVKHMAAKRKKPS